MSANKFEFEFERTQIGPKCSTHSYVVNCEVTGSNLPKFVHDLTVNSRPPPGRLLLSPQRVRPMACSAQSLLAKPSYRTSTLGEGSPKGRRSPENFFVGVMYKYTVSHPP